MTIPHADLIRAVSLPEPIRAGDMPSGAQVYVPADMRARDAMWAAKLAEVERLTLERAKAVCLSAPLKHPNQDVREACANAVLGLGEKT